MSTESTFIQHLIELRTRIIRIAFVILLFFLMLFRWSADIYQFLALPMLKNLPLGGQMIAIEVTSPFAVPLKLTLMCAFLLSLPHSLYQIWKFIAPGLYTSEKHVVIPLIAGSSLLFLLGMSFAYFVVFPTIFHFITHVAPVGVAVMTDINRYLDFVLSLFLTFGMTFEVPIVILVLVKSGMVTIKMLTDFRRYMIVFSFVIAAIVTPPDVLSQIMLAVPICLLYELGIGTAKLFSPRPEAQGR
ncbi:MAG: twin-arginine translocase subunit TatC [Legionellales bacterium]|nr:twin-arginine translocase subunit TatC [Legionellales bacterium]